MDDSQLLRVDDELETVVGRVGTLDGHAERLYW
jgi:hypothetical protein